MRTLRSQIIKLAHTSPELREHLLPLLKEADAPLHKEADAPRPIHEIAAEIWKDWGRSKVSPTAKPWLEALSELDKITDSYGADPGHLVVAYFLSNASGWKGEVAKRVKKELKALSKR